MLHDFGDCFSSSNCVPVFELADNELNSWIERAQSPGASIVHDGLKDPAILSVIAVNP